ncbi:MAG: DUF11 domain-containing protein [Candidatus Contendobacter sp.]|nr:DUF11 domain-containing protein [Candidatus Contendobacter sp.]MDS4057198.1 DUF11 domain-containing protein [Candidatus Contendobacter sp.]
MSASLTEIWTKLLPVNDRQSATINLAFIPNGARITAVDIIVCQSSTLLTGGTFQTFTRMNGANTDSGTNIVTGGGFGNRTATTLEVGVLKTGSGGVLDPSRRSVNVYALAGKVNYLASDLALAGQTLTYTLSVTNNGPDAILAGENIVALDTLPVGYTVTASSGDGSYNTETHEWTISGGLASAATATLQLTVPVPSSKAQGAILGNIGDHQHPPGQGQHQRFDDHNDHRQPFG